MSDQIAPVLNALVEASNMMESAAENATRQHADDAARVLRSRAKQLRDEAQLLHALRTFGPVGAQRGALST